MHDSERSCLRTCRTSGVLALPVPLADVDASNSARAATIREHSGSVLDMPTPMANVPLRYAAISGRPNSKLIGSVLLTVELV